MSILIFSTNSDGVKFPIEDVEQLSPSNHKLSISTTICIAVGDNETDEFIRQSTAFSNKLLDDGHINELLILKKQNHYDVVSRLAEENGLLQARIKGILILDELNKMNVLSS